MALLLGWILIIYCLSSQNTFLLAGAFSGVYWKQALLNATYPSSQATYVAAFYSQDSLIPTTRTHDITIAEYQLVEYTALNGLCNTSVDHASLDWPGAEIERPFAILMQYNECSIEVATMEAEQLGAGVALVYSPGPVSTGFSPDVDNPLRVLSPSNRRIQTIGISRKIGVYMSSVLAQDQTLNVTIEPRADYIPQAQQLQHAMFLQLSFCVVALSLLAIAILMYAKLHIQTRQVTLNQRSRADQARERIDELPERTLDESIMDDEEYATCVVCIDNLESGDTIRTLPCNHVFHKDCIDRWLIARQTCPLCKYNILSGTIEEDEEMDVQDAAAEIALGNMPDSVLEEAAALPLPPSRLSRFLDSSLQRERMVSSRAASVLQSGQRTHTATPEFANASSASNNLNDSLVSPSLLPSIEQAEQSGCSRAPDDASQSSMSTHSLTLRPDVRIAQPNMSNSWRTAFSSNSAVPEVISPNRRMTDYSPNRTSVSMLTRMFTSAVGHRHRNHGEHVPLSGCSDESEQTAREVVEMI
ncbi:E3 ubiquitin-protein ligase RNF149-like [Sycon ciliatum]|uniref:E3 ubiquitin-protein ligase RNF149-like n=1 Tax=Sycon ciliatum TaxID=27933 RepID=UPI0020A944F0|eukprot:scpid52388/ scgid28142/ E3 ubiquitin-protein ligase RNF130; G1-related zinc finger protein; Goliath homolog; RING finger protein 130